MHTKHLGAGWGVQGMTHGRSLKSKRLGSSPPGSSTRSTVGRQRVGGISSRCHQQGRCGTFAPVACGRIATQQSRPLESALKALLSWHERAGPGSVTSLEGSHLCHFCPKKRPPSGTILPTNVREETNTLGAHTLGAHCAPPLLPFTPSRLSSNHDRANL